MGRSDTRNAIKEWKEGSATALSHLEQAYKSAPTDDELCYVYGNALVLEGKNVDLGISILQAIVDRTTSLLAKKRLGDVHYAIGYGYLRKNVPEKALGPLEEASRLYRKDKSRILDCVKCLNRLAEVHLSANREAVAKTLLADAKELLSKSSLPPTNVHVRNLFVRAKVYRQEGLYESSVTEAREALELALKLDNKDQLLIDEIRSFINKRRISIRLGIGAGIALAAGFCAAVAMSL